MLHSKQIKKANLIFSDPVLNQSVQTDSQEEIALYNWCVEASQVKFINSWSEEFPLYHPASIKLADTVKDDKGKTILRPHEYTPDFDIWFTPLFFEIFPNMLTFFKFSEELNGNKRVLIDVKGVFNMHGGDRIFAINQKWVYQKSNLYINKLVPDDLFRETFVPKLELYTKKTHKLREKYLTFKTIDQYINNDGQ